MSNLVKHAQFELKLAELDQEDSDYGGVVRFENITPIGKTADEWVEVYNTEKTIYKKEV